MFLNFLAAALLDDIINASSIIADSRHAMPLVAVCAAIGVLSAIYDAELLTLLRSFAAVGPSNEHV